MSNMRVCISDKISMIVEPLERFYHAKLLIICDNRELDSQKTFIEEGIRADQKLHLFGV